MANRRMIISEMWEDEFFISLSYVQRLAWIGLITCMADDQGRFQDNPGFLRSHIFPNDEVSIPDMEDALILFSTPGKILRYMVGGKKLCQILNWWKHQHPTWAAPSIYPAPEGWQDRCRYNGPGGKQILVNWDKEGGYIPGNILHNIPGNILDSLSLSKDKDKDKDKGKDEQPSRPPIFTLYEQNIGTLAGMMIDELKDAEKTYPAEWIPLAFKEAVDHNARSWKYVLAVLKNWKEKGFPTNGNGKNGNGHKPALTYTNAAGQPTDIFGHTAEEQ